MCKKRKYVDYNQCDFCCSEEDCYSKCLTCGKDVCYECKKTVGVSYEHSVFWGGSGDGFYCYACDAITKSKIHTAYRLIRALRLEGQGFNAEFSLKAKEANKYVEQLLKEAGI